MTGPSNVYTTYRKSYPGNPLVLSDMTYDDLERSYQGHAGVNGLIPWKQCVLGPRIALTADSKPYAENPMVLSDLT